MTRGEDSLPSPRDDRPKATSLRFTPAALACDAEGPAPGANSWRGQVSIPAMSPWTGSSDFASRPTSAIQTCDLSRSKCLIPSQSRISSRLACPYGRKRPSQPRVTADAESVGAVGTSVPGRPRVRRAVIVIAARRPGAPTCPRPSPLDLTRHKPAHPRPFGRGRSASSAG